MNAIPNMSAISELTAKRAKAQSYFDRYPERKGQGPYVPKAKLVHSTSSKAIEKEANTNAVKIGSKSIEKTEQSSSSSSSVKKKKQESVEQTDQRISKRRESDVDINSVKQWHTRTSEGPRFTEATVGRLEENRKSETPTLKQLRDGMSSKFTSSVPASSKGSLPPSRSTGSAQIPSLTYDIDQQSFEKYGDVITIGIGKHNESSGRLPSSSFGKNQERSVSANQYPKQTSMNGNQSNSIPPAKPAIRSRNTDAKSDSTTSTDVLSIDDIIRRHTPTFTTDDEGNITLLQPHATSSYGRRPSGNTVGSHSSGEIRNKGLDVSDSNEAGDGNQSDSSLDSVELEIQNSLRITKPNHSRTQSGIERMMFASSSPALQASFNQPLMQKSREQISPKDNDNTLFTTPRKFAPHPMVPSVSAPALIHKKSTPSLMFSKVTSSGSKRDRSKHLDKGFFDSLPRQHKSSLESSQESDASSSLNIPSIHRSKSSADLFSGSRAGQSPFHTKRSSSASLAVVPPVPPLPNKRTQKLPAAPARETDEAKMIRQFVHSNRLTQLLILYRPPYAGRTVSFADVGDSKGHAVIVFMGLGAVRYLVGLYDEMALALGLRLICIDRWGMGRTDDLPSDKRGVLEWSSVVAEVADRLDIQKFSILAHSAGAPYAMATTLMHSNRLVGPVHLLAPWVSPVIESGYKWLRYVPDGVIRTAQAAEWRMQGWKLGVNSKTVQSSNADDDRDSSFSSRDDFDGREITYIDATSSAMIPNRSFDSSIMSTNSSTGIEVLNASPMATSPSTGGTTKSQKSSERNDQDRFGHKASPSRWSLASLAEHYDVVNAWHMRANGIESSSGPPVPPKTPSKDRSAPMTPSPNPSPITPNTKTSPYSASDLPTELLKASHAESGGASHDLLVILGRASQKPWGFAYTDIDYPVRVWHGDKDERINVTSVLWMEREMRDCQVTFVKNANHSLMTNVSVVVEALESIASFSS